MKHGTYSKSPRTSIGIGTVLQVTEGLELEGTKM